MSAVATGPSSIGGQEAIRGGFTQDCQAAFRLLWARWAGVAISLWTVSVMGVLLVGLIRQLFIGDWLFASNACVLVMIVTQAPLLLWSVFAVDWWGPDINRKASGFDAFLLRSPILSARLMVVAVLARHVAIVISLMMFAISIEISQTSNEEHWWGIYPALLISLGTASLLVLAFCWRPFAWAGTRVLSLLVLIPLVYVISVWPFAATSPGHPRFLVWGFLPWPLLLLWAAALALVYQSLELARSNSYGLDDRGTLVATLRGWSSRIADRVLSIGGSGQAFAEGRALRWFESRQTRSSRWSMVAWIGVPSLVLLGLLPLNAASVVIAALIVLTYTELSIAGGWSEMHGANRGGQGRAMPLLLAVSPVSRERLAGVKIQQTLWLVSTASVVTFGVLAVFAVPRQWDVWKRWAESIHVGPPGDAISTGVGVSLALVLFLFVSLVGRGLAMLWLSLMSNRKVTYSVVIAGCLLVLLFTVTWVSWFIAQEEWEVMLDELRQSLQQIPSWMGVLLAMKSVAVISAAILAIRQPGRCWSWVAKTTLGWLLCVATTSLVLLFLLPAEIHFSETWPRWRLDAWIIWAATMLMLPLARLLILPWAVGRDIHR
ncbi:hypothetical protein LOC71_16735 [Rhodopirellula sp. JC740]|uniref:ABC transporter permease n=1 Tax=Rhodopirellula halodulae TaxID=2894198 RepID=A0ABS8NK58_9BACT|nr:hypothetical protein [Rhodopirellula sp. JC740]MCC9643934.1 hypothetical protein [Rhodopirellula sp. JC740]